MQISTAPCNDASLTPFLGNSKLQNKPASEGKGPVAKGKCLDHINIQHFDLAPAQEKKNQKNDEDVQNEPATSKSKTGKFFPQICKIDFVIGGNNSPL